jgi:hypothetical protein
VEQLWGDYGEALDKEKKTAEDDECVLVEKEDAAIPKEGESEEVPTPTSTVGKGEITKTSATN